MDNNGDNSAVCDGVDGGCAALPTAVTTTTYSTVLTTLTMEAVTWRCADATKTLATTGVHTTPIAMHRHHPVVADAAAAVLSPSP